MFDIDSQKAQDIMKNFQMPVKPQILVEIQDVQSAHDPSPNAYSDVISKDVALSAAVLKVVNSPVFGLKRTVTDIRQSIVLLGINNITNLVSFFQLKQSFKKKSSISLEKFWDTSMDTANMITLVLEHLSLKEQCPIEDAYAFGLFRDCGIPLLAMKYDDYKEVLIEANSRDEVIFTSIEEDKYNTNHATVGFFLASSWHLPKDLCELILRHHEPDYLESQKSNQQKQYLYALAKIASNILAQYRMAKDDVEWRLAKEPVLGFLGLSEFDYAELEEDLKEVFNIKFG